MASALVLVKILSNILKENTWVCPKIALDTRFIYIRIWPDSDLRIFDSCATLENKNGEKWGNTISITLSWFPLLAGTQPLSSLLTHKSLSTSSACKWSRGPEGQLDSAPDYPHGCHPHAHTQVACWRWSHPGRRVPARQQRLHRPVLLWQITSLYFFYFRSEQKFV